MSNEHNNHSIENTIGENLAKGFIENISKMEEAVCEDTFNKLIKPLADKWVDDLVKDGLVNEDGTIPIAEWKNLHGDFVVSNDNPISYNFINATPNCTIQFHNKENKVVGTFDFNEDKLKFEGDVYESAQLFVDFVLRLFNQKIDQIKDEAALKGYKNGWKEAKEEYNEQFDPRED